MQTQSLINKILTLVDDHIPMEIADWIQSDSRMLDSFEKSSKETKQLLIGIYYDLALVKIIKSLENHQTQIYSEWESKKLLEKIEFPQTI